MQHETRIHTEFWIEGIMEQRHDTKVKMGGKYKNGSQENRL